MAQEPEIDTDRIDDAVPALLWVTEREGRPWEGHDWDALGRLHAKGLIGDPVGKQKSVWLTREGLERWEAMFHTLFARKP